MSEETRHGITGKRLYKSRTNRIIDGVCGGVAEYFEIDPTIVRILWVLVSLSGAGFLLYLAAMIIIPVRPIVDEFGNASMVTAPKMDKKRFWGVLLILVGAFILLSNLGLIAEFWWWSFSGKVVFPVLLIILGVVLIYTRTRRATAEVNVTMESGTPSPQPTPQRELRRSISDRKLFGVCGGLAKYLDLDPTLVRILYVILVLASFGWALLLYIIMAILMPEEKPTVIPQ
jgi:phage shock protein C